MLHPCEPAGERPRGYSAYLRGGTSGAVLKSAIPFRFWAFGVNGLLNRLKRKGDVTCQFPGRDDVAVSPIGAEDHQSKVTVLRPFRGSQAVTVVCFDNRYATCVVIN